MPQTPRHKVFISFHQDDQKYKKRFAQMMKGNVVDKSVEDGDIDDQNVKTTTIRQKIRDEFIADATVTVVLIGPCTWQRKHVDWEIGSSLRDTEKNPRCGLLGILLPKHPDFGKEEYDPHLIPPRLADNCEGDDPYACPMIGIVKLWTFASGFTERSREGKEHQTLITNRSSFDAIEEASVQKAGSRGKKFLPLQWR